MNFNKVMWLLLTKLTSSHDIPIFKWCNRLGIQCILLHQLGIVGLRWYLWWSGGECPIQQPVDTLFTSLICVHGLVMPRQTGECIAAKVGGNLIDLGLQIYCLGTASRIPFVVWNSKQNSVSSFKHIRKLVYTIGLVWIEPSEMRLSVLPVSRTVAVVRVGQSAQLVQQYWIVFLTVFRQSF